MSELVLREDRAGGVAVLTLNRPDALNALSPELFVELRGHVDAIAEAAETVGCVVLTGAGRSFSAGNDLKAIRAGAGVRSSSPPTSSSSRPVGRGGPPTKYFQAETVEALEALPQPVIGAVRGHCYTGALELVLACDLIVAADDARFADTHGKWAMAPGWGMSQRLPRRIGQAKAKEMMFTGRPVGGEEAAAIGLANMCVPSAELLDRTLELADQIVINSWHTLRADKMLVRGGDGLSLAEGLRFERAHSPGRGPDLEERLTAFGRKR